jgi:hypothetical protein
VKFSQSNLRSGKLWILILLIIVLLGILGYRELDKHWISTGERKAAIRTIYSIDGLTDASSGASISRSEANIEQLLADAHIAARTKKDKWIASQLDEYFFWSGMARPADDSQSSLLSWIGTLDASDPRRDRLIKMFHDGQVLEQERQAMREKDSKTAAEIRGRLMTELE